MQLHWQACSCSSTSSGTTTNGHVPRNQQRLTYHWWYLFSEYQRSSNPYTRYALTCKINPKKLPILCEYVVVKSISQVFGPFYSPSATHYNNVVPYTPRCHPGTRVAILNRLSSWVKDSESSVHVSWLYGPAGAGKSAIAYSLAECLNAEGLLAGSFFFFRSDAS